MNSLFTVTPQNPECVPNAQVTFQGLFGTAPYAYSVVMGGAGGTIDPSTGVYTAPAVQGSDTIQVTDAKGLIVGTGITIEDTPMVSDPGSLTVVVDGAVTLSITGGTAPYSFAVNAGGVGGTIDSDGVYSAPSGVGLDVVTVTDFTGETLEVYVTVNTLPLVLLPDQLAIALGRSVQFQAVGGTPAVSTDGSGTLVYRYYLESGVGYVTEDGFYNSGNQNGVAVIAVEDSLNTIARSQITVGNPLLLLCEIIRHELDLADDRVWMWDQKVDEPTDSDMYVIVGVLQQKNFGSRTKSNPDDLGMHETQSVNCHAIISIDIKSRSTEAFDRKEEVVMALNSVYSQQQQELNGFRIFPLPSQMVNIPALDGAAIPYRFNLSCALQFQVTKRKAVPFYDTFTVPPAVTTD